MNLTIEVEQEDDGRWLAEIPELAGVLAYGQTRQEAIGQAKALAFRVIADRLSHGEKVPDVDHLFSVVP
jgi:predicted RNase H-like HicB family nuclease